MKHSKRVGLPVRLIASNIRAFSLAELLVVVAIIGVLSSIILGISFSILRRERANSAAIEITGWLENLRNIAMKRVDPDAESGGCPVIFSEKTVISSRDAIASSPCLPDSDLRLEAASVSEFDFQFSVLNASSNSNEPDIVFTPRGTVFSSDQESPVLIKIFPEGGPLRCIRIDEILGVVRIGKNNSAPSISVDCNDFSRY
ncbi:prepilin-type N-terminal cleavage/methylation domain-containing protein [Cyanobium sp. FACHB-13342]|uniref:prepilin-type N-terminal cleavage/methylation domain-containing protein n=1 Tax=Cyanobium sp. FACHB-13342 TaxID=2692793 RepID=UPI0016802FBB|nr:prepilin-type N-terminal cleavage/methylation domain-containing protein [Cyanobium sp. FACHB-13342]MBD2422764.1 prepilin-type N-terminal cleavage/methylation domain-containing protein [Cyanobium sp. FACHB-13342]